MTRGKHLSLNAICFIIAGVILLTFTGVKAFSSTISTDIKSRGVLQYDDTTTSGVEPDIVIDTADFFTLATEIDGIKAKLGLNSVNS